MECTQQDIVEILKKSINAKFLAENYIVDQVIDWFGKDISIKEAIYKSGQNIINES